MTRSAGTAEPALHCAAERNATADTKAELKAVAESIANLVLRLDALVDDLPAMPAIALPTAATEPADDLVDWGELIDSILAVKEPTRAMTGWKSEGVITGEAGARAMLAGIRDFYAARGQISEKQIIIIKMCCPPHLRCW